MGQVWILPTSHQEGPCVCVCVCVCVCDKQGGQKAMQGLGSGDNEVDEDARQNTFSISLYRLVCLWVSECVCACVCVCSYWCAFGCQFGLVFICICTVCYTLGVPLQV